ncbi:hypothetical protein KVQ82_23535 [Pseudomonas sp. AO-1]|uniref:hypothetical protein n=1 Tax=Pseudomonas sp. AO-1 TaxID=2855434 RepID=UPI001C754D52|nr:hypothetical protein [Pseudomonas sp. AO-1]QXZ13022.1 hypothetical protein KVQ82_23535 [Pseudomonas sp. AO-1]
MIDGLERILLEKYQPDSPKLQKPLEAPISASKSELVSSEGITTKASHISSQGSLYKSVSGRTGVITVLMDSTKYPDEIIAKACAEFNRNNPSLMSNSYQLPTEFEGVPAGSWIYINYIDKE